MKNLKYAILLGVALPVGVAAQQIDNLPAPQSAQDEDIVVTASGIEQSADETGQAVTVITREEIGAFRSVDQVLARTPGITVARNGGTGQVSGVFIRGAESYQTLVLLDGVKINDPSAPQGGVDFGQLLSGNIGRIEVLRGPNGIVWGSQAIGGVINVISEQPTDGFEARVRGEYGYRDSYQGFANIAGTSAVLGGTVQGSAGIGYLDSDGISAFDENLGGLERDGYENLTANGKIRLAYGDGFALDLRGYYVDGEVEFDGFPPPNFALADTAAFARNQLFVGYVGAEANFADGRFRNRFAFTYTDVSRDSFDRVAGAPVPDFLADGELERFEYRGSFKAAEPVTLLFGAETELSRLETFSPMFDPAPSRFSSRQTGVYGEAIVKPLIGLTLTGGVRYDDQRDGESEITFGANIAYSPNDGATVLRGTYAEGFRAPSLFERFSAFGTPGLVAETARSFDIGIEQSFLDDRAEIGVTYFNRDTDNQIDFEFATFTYRNIARTHADGVETVLRLRPTDRLTVSGQYSRIDSENRSPGGNFGNRLARRPDQTVSVSADWSTPVGLDLGLSVLAVGDAFDDPGNFVPLDGYALVDIRASYGLTEAIALFGRIENLFDAQYQTVSGFGTPGAAGYAGLRARF